MRVRHDKGISGHSKFFARWEAEAVSRSSNLANTSTAPIHEYAQASLFPLRDPKPTEKRPFELRLL